MPDFNIYNASINRYYPELYSSYTPQNTIQNSILSMPEYNLDFNNILSKAPKINGLKIDTLQIPTYVDPTLEKKFNLGKAVGNGALLGANGGIDLDPTSLGFLFAGNVADFITGSLLANKRLYEGPKGDITVAGDAIYLGLTDAVGSVPILGGIGKAGLLINRTIGRGINKLTGGTDSMTGVDAFLGSDLMSLSPVGMTLNAVNNLTGRRADTITMDEEAFETVGSSYTGTLGTVNDALQKSGKKYGGFSSGARHKANREIAEAKRLQNLMADIADEATDRFAIRNSMSAINGNRRAFNMLGGYLLQYIHAARLGMKFLDLEKARKILSAKKGDKIKKVRTLEEIISSIKEINPRFILRLMEEVPRGIGFTDDEGNFGYGNVYLEYGTDDNGNNIIYPRILEIENKLTFLDSNTAYNNAILNKDYIILSPEETNLFFAEDPEYQVAYKRYFPNTFNKDWNNPKESGIIIENEVPKKENGGIIEPSYIELNNESYIELSEEGLDDEVLEFEKGGLINVIPEGALHARKHHLDIENCTSKGIPVISEDENGNIELQAEVECNEIILRLSLTQKLEELQKEYYKEDTKQKDKDNLALEAGKLLVLEILYNTLDNTNLINKVQ